MSMASLTFDRSKDKSRKGKLSKPKEKESTEKRKVPNEMPVPAVELKKRKKADASVENVPGLFLNLAGLNSTIQGVSCKIFQEDTFLNKVEVKIDIPRALQPILVDDWDLIVRQKQVRFETTPAFIVALLLGLGTPTRLPTRIRIEYYL